MADPTVTIVINKSTSLTLKVIFIRLIQIKLILTPSELFN